MKRVLLASLLLAACQSGPSATYGNDASADASAVSVDHPSLEDVHAAIKASGAGWVASTNPIAALPVEDRAMMLGVSDMPIDRMRVREENDSTARARDALPSIHDWRNKDGVSYVSPVIDQGRCGSCVAFATIGTFESQLNIAANDPSSPWQLSPQYLFSCGGGRCGWGWNVGPAAKFLEKTGVPDNSCMRYTSGAHGDDAKCSSACSDVKARVVKTTGSSRPSSGGSSVAKVKQALMNGPLVATMTVYDDFMYYASGVYEHVTGGVAGGHAVSIVGWNDEHQSWIVRNSWGTGWGMGGFFEIDWNDASGVGEATWALEVPTPGPYVSIVGVRDGDLFSGKVALTFESRGLDGVALSWSLQSGSQAGVESASTELDSTQFADGVYTLRARGGSVSGPARTISILNGPLSGTIDFVKLKDGDTLKGDAALFDIALKPAPVPLTQVSWTITNAAGETVVDRVSHNTGPVMELGWNTKRWPNGVYVIRLNGAAGEQALAGAQRTVNVKN